MWLNKVRSRVVGAAIGVAICMAGFGLVSVSAQTISGTAIQSVLQSLGQTTSTTSTSPPAPTQLPAAVTPSTTTLQPAPTVTTTTLPASRLELLYSQRAGQPLQQFGYDYFGVGSPVTASQIGGVQDNYILGPGDQLSVVLRGHDNSAYTVPVDRDGRIIIPNYEPVMAAGRTFGEVRKELAARVAKDALSTLSYISLASARQISIFVTGEVNSPGVRTLSGLNTPIDAILLSGGIQKTGSLRNVILERNGVRHRIDLYSIIAHGNTLGIGSLTEGDRIIVPPIGATVAVIGLVKRPGIYELAPGSHAIDGRALMRLAGGSEIAGAERLSKIALRPGGGTRLVALGRDGMVDSGEILSVDEAAGGAVGRVTLVGAVQLPGTRPLNGASSLSQLFHDPSQLTDDAYTPFAIVVHRDPQTNFKRAVVFSLKRVFEGLEDRKLQSGDVVYVFTSTQVQALAAAAVAQMQAASQAANVPPSVLSQSAQSLSSVNLSQPTQAGLPLGTTTTAATTSQPTASSSTSSTSPATPSAPISVPTLSPSQIALLTPQQLQMYQNAQAAASAQQTPSTTPTSGNTTTTQSTTTPQQSAATTFTPPATPQIDPRLAAAESGAPPASVAILQAQNAASGNQIESNGLTSPAGLGAPTPDMTPTGIAAQLDITPAALLNLASDYVVWVSGAVHDPGPYLADNGTTLAAMMGAAGGMQRDADLSWVEVTSTAVDPLTGTSKTARTAYKGTLADLEKVSLRPLDSIRVRQIFTDRGENGNVTVAGQVRYPGTFDITRGERLSSILARAGGLTDEAYPYGAVFTRVSAAQAESEGNLREANELQAGISASLTNPSLNASALTYLQNLVQTLQHQPALGRITVTADPAVLSVKPSLDILLEPGDFIYIPKRPSTVAVSGEVLNPGAFQYRPGLSVDDYLRMAGGANDAAEESETFIVMPDGTAQPASGGMFSFMSSTPIPPGATIVVPPNPAPWNTMVFLTSISQIVSQLAIAGASLAVINRGSGN
jgi:polysaccharide biosynthesis/export protein